MAKKKANKEVANNKPSQPARKGNMTAWVLRVSQSLRDGTPTNTTRQLLSTAYAKHCGGNQASRNLAGLNSSPLAEAVRGVFHSLFDHLQKHDAEIKELQDKVATVMKELADASKAQSGENTFQERTTAALALLAKTSAQQNDNLNNLLGHMNEMLRGQRPYVRDDSDDETFHPKRKRHHHPSPSYSY